MTTHRRLPAGVVVVIAAITLLYSGDSPAPPPPILNCASGIPASLALEFPTPVSGSINSTLGFLRVQALDSAGNPLRDVPITLSAPATGPSAIFVTIIDPYNYAPTPEPLQMTSATYSNCEGAVAWPVANGIVGSYQITASTPSVPQPLLIGATNTPPEVPDEIASEDLTTQRIAHTGAAFPPVRVAVSGATGLGIAGVPIMLSLPLSGPSATFPGGGTTATVYTNAFGRATSPTLGANAQPGSFSVHVSSPGRLSIEVGPFVNAGATQTQLDTIDPDDPTNGFVDTFAVTFGQTVNVRALVTFPGLPLPPYPGPAGLPQPNGKVVLRVDGNVVAFSALDSFYYLRICTDCLTPTLVFFFRVNAFPFGQHQLTATYEGDSAYESSASLPNMVSVPPEFTIPTATQAGESFIGATGGAPDTWSCTLENATWVSIGQLGAAAESPPYSFPYGLLSYRLDQCSYHSPVFLGPPPLYQVLVLELPAPLPPGTVFVNYGPTRENPAPHWYELAVQIDGATIRIPLRDGAAGDDEFATYGVIAGLGGPALPAVAPATTQVVEFYAPSLDHYFISVDVAEITALDTHAIPGWARTGIGFNAYSNDAANTQPVCRYYIPPQEGDSHFYSASIAECAQVRARFPDFVYESPDVFHVALPDISTGACPAGTIPVYRVWNQRADSNHRYTTSRTIRDQMVARGYVAEGYGPDAVIMCAAP